MKTVRIILCVLLPIVLLLAPAYLRKQAQSDFFDSVRHKEPQPAYGTVTLYHIVSARTYSGSLTKWLQFCAERYEKKHKGTHIEVEGMTEETYRERVAYGRLPDGYSFFSGMLDRESLQPVGLTSENLREGLFDADYAVPYCVTGYAAIRTEQADVPLPEANATAALMCLEAEGTVCDWRSIGDRLRDESFGALYTAEPVGNFTDAVCWLGVASAASEQTALALREFFAYILDEAQQRTLGQLGAIPARNDVAAEYAAPLLKELAAAYETVQTVDPFLLAAQRDALRSDAEAAYAGDAEAERRFRDRMMQILWK
ncbi:MAG: hypothetical protein IJP98_01350 [Clostridia bacterium]|nr:hypothetical protein [Clostridia bacterium]